MFRSLTASGFDYTAPIAELGPDAILYLDTNALRFREQTVYYAVRVQHRGEHLPNSVTTSCEVPAKPATETGSFSLPG